jgi:Uma2 family endonuclease
MTQAIEKPQLMTLDEFLAWYPEDGKIYELHKGVIFEMQPTGTHQQIAGELSGELFLEIRRLHLPYTIPSQCIVKSINTDNSGFNPDVTILDKNVLENEPMWKKRSTITNGETVKLAVEVVSTNWQHDYLMKLFEYENLGIYEYWIVDYLGLGGRRFIGSPKQPTIFVYVMVDGEYEVKTFRGSDRIESSIFPELNLTAEQIFAAGS